MPSVQCQNTSAFHPCISVMDTAAQAICTAISTELGDVSSNYQWEAALPEYSNKPTDYFWGGGVECRQVWSMKWTFTCS